MKKRIVTGLAIFAGLFLSVTQVFAQEESLLCTKELDQSYTFVFSGGKWTSQNFYFFESDIGSGQINCHGKANFRISLPDKALEAVRRGSDIRVKIEKPSIYSNIDTTSFEYSVSGNTLSFSVGLSPKTAGTLNSYVSGLNTSIPLIDYKYGKNIYTVYPPMGEPTEAEGHGTASIPFLDDTIGKIVDVVIPFAGQPSKIDGWYASTIPGYVNGTYIHPSSIKNSKGSFVSGTKIWFNGKERNAIFYSIGKDNSFANGGAVSLCFYCPMKIVFYEIKKDENVGETENSFKKAEEHAGETGANQGNDLSDFETPIYHFEEINPFEDITPPQEKTFDLRLHRVR